MPRLEKGLCFSVAWETSLCSEDVIFLVSNSVLEEGVPPDGERRCSVDQDTLKALLKEAMAAVVEEKLQVLLELERWAFLQD